LPENKNNIAVVLARCKLHSFYLDEQATQLAGNARHQQLKTKV
jgi:hypothetical protein